MKDLSQEKRKKVLNETVADLFCAIGPEDVLFRHGYGENGEDVWFLGDRKITKEQLHYYAGDAETIMNMRFWQEIVKCVKYLALRKMFQESRNYEELMAGKMTLYLLKTFEDILKKASEFKIKK